MRKMSLLGGLRPLCSSPSLGISCNHRVPSPIGNEPRVVSQGLQSSHTCLVLPSHGAVNAAWSG